MRMRSCGDKSGNGSHATTDVGTIAATKDATHDVSIATNAANRRDGYCEDTSDGTCGRGTYRRNDNSTRKENIGIDQAQSFDSETLNKLKRKELQRLCKLHGFRANSKNVEMVAALTQYYEQWRASELEGAANVASQPGLATQDQSAAEISKEIHLRNSLNDQKQQVSFQSNHMMDDVKDNIEEKMTILEHTSAHEHTVPGSPKTPTSSAEINAINDCLHTPKSNRKTWKDSPKVSSLKKFSSAIDGSTAPIPLSKSRRASMLRESVMGDLQRIIQQRRTSATPQRQCSSPLNNSSHMRATRTKVGKDKTQMRKPKPQARDRFDHLHNKLKSETLKEEYARRQERHEQLCREHKRWDRLASRSKRKQLEQTEENDEKSARVDTTSKLISNIRRPKEIRQTRSQRPLLSTKTRKQSTIRSEQLKQKKKLAQLSALHETKRGDESRIPFPDNYVTPKAKPRREVLSCLQTPASPDPHEAARLRRERQKSYVAPRPNISRKTRS